METKPNQYGIVRILTRVYSQNIDQGMLRSAQPSQFSTYPNQNIDTPGLAVLVDINIKMAKTIVYKNPMYFST